MSLIIETGSGVADAESFATAAELVAFATRFAYTAPATVDLQEAFLLRAAAEMNSMNWIGDVVSYSQALPWPRANACTRRGHYVPITLIPREIKYGQMALAIELYKADQTPDVEAGTTGLVTSITKTVEGAVSLSKTYDNTGKTSPVSPSQSSAVQFGDYIVNGLLRAIRV